MISQRGGKSCLSSDSREGPPTPGEGGGGADDVLSLKMRTAYSKQKKKGEDRASDCWPGLAEGKKWSVKLPKSRSFWQEEKEAKGFFGLRSGGEGGKEEGAVAKHMHLIEEKRSFESFIEGEAPQSHMWGGRRYPLEKLFFSPRRRREGKSLLIS